jgi:hypothetical protein
VSPYPGFTPAPTFPAGVVARHYFEKLRPRMDSVLRVGMRLRYSLASTKCS